MADYIEPMTDGTLTVLVEDAATGEKYDDAVVTATVYSPKGQQIVEDTALTSTGGGSGAYVLDILPAWSTQAGRPIQGEFLVEVKAVRAGIQRVRHIRYPVRFADDT